MLHRKLAFKPIVDRSFLALLPVTICRRWQAALCVLTLPGLQALGRPQSPQDGKRVPRAASQKSGISVRESAFIHTFIYSFISEYIYQSKNLSTLSKWGVKLPDLQVNYLEISLMFSHALNILLSSKKKKIKNKAQLHKIRAEPERWGQIDPI